jgi:hypothetical protein
MLINLSLFPYSFKYLFSILIITVILSFLSCSSARHSAIDKPLAERKVGSDSNEIKLGDTKFYLTVSDNIKITEARGKEGQHGFYILPKDDSSKIYGFIETQHGRPIGDSSFNDCKDGKVYTKSIFLNKQVTWTMCLFKNKYFNVETKGYNGVTAYAYADKISDIDNMISIIGTLTEK